MGAAAYLAGAIDLNFEHDVHAGGRLRLRGAVVVTEEVRPLEEATRIDVRLELCPGHKMVCIGRLPRSLFASRPGAAQPQLAVAFHEFGNDGALADARGPTRQRQVRSFW